MYYLRIRFIILILRFNGNNVFFNINNNITYKVYIFMFLGRDKCKKYGGICERTKKRIKHFLMSGAEE